MTLGVTLKAVSRLEDHGIILFFKYAKFHEKKTHEKYYFWNFRQNQLFQNGG